MLIGCSTPSLSPAYKKILLRYHVSNVEEYYQLVSNALKNDSVDEINKSYEKNKIVDIQESSKKEKEKLKNKIEASISKLSENIIIRMITEEDEDDATNLYIMFKETMNEDIEKARDYTQDFILKNIMFGIFIDEILAGFVIIHFSKNFNIDSQNQTMPTFYIQELLIKPSYRGNKLSKALLEYCIYRCPKDKMYVSLMTMPDNKALQNIAESVGFVKQNTPSGDSKHSLLMIKNMDKLENSVPNLCTYGQSISPKKSKSPKTSKNSTSQKNS
jgi:GNAT superfamily N-acetyltransferase